MHEIFQFLQWAVPGGIGGAVAWILSKRIRNTRNDKVVHDTYKAMYHDISNEIMQLRNENAKIIQQSDTIAEESRALKRALQRLSKAIQDIQNAVQLCPYHSNCPVRSQLQDTAGDGNFRTQGLDTSLQHGNGANDHDHATKRVRHRENGARHNHDPTTAAGGGMDDDQRERHNHGEEDQQRDDHHRNSTKDTKGNGAGQCTSTSPASPANTKQGHGKGQ